MCFGGVISPSFSQCFFTAINVNVSGCDPADNSFDITGDLEFQDAPTTGQLIIEDCNGNQQTFNAPFSSPLNFALNDIDSDGTSGCEVYAYFSDNPSCDITSAAFDYPVSCVCDADVGSFTDSLSGVSSATNPFSLCFGDELHIDGNGDFIPSADFGTPGITYDPGVFLFVFTCPPTVSEPDDLNTDPCFAGLYSSVDQDWTITNTLGDSSTFWFVPVTMYSMVDMVYAVSINGGDYCYDMGPAYQVTFLEENSVTNVSADTATCSGGEYSTSGQIDFVNPPSSGQLIVADCNGNQESFDPPFSSPISYTLTGQICDGDSCSIMAYFTSDSTVCNVVTTYTSPESDLCDATIDPLPNDTVCSFDGLYSLSAADTSGTWSASCGTCIDQDGVFDPGMAVIGNNTIYYTVTDTNCSDQDSLVIYVSICGSLSEQGKVDVKVYPNPASSEINLTAESPMTSIKIIDMQGKLHDRLVISHTKDHSFDISQYEKGVYLMEIQTVSGKVNRKLMIE